MSNNSCVPCHSSRRRCMFLNVDDISCTRCRRNGIACYIKLSGESLCSFSPAPSSPLSNVVYFHYSARGATTRCIEEKLAIFFPSANHKFFPPPSGSQLDTCLLLKNIKNIHVDLKPHPSHRHCSSFFLRFVGGHEQYCIPSG